MLRGSTRSLFFTLVLCENGQSFDLPVTSTWNLPFRMPALPARGQGQNKSES